MKKCYLCEATKDPKDFYKDKSRKDGLSTKCKDCAKTYKVKRPVGTHKTCPRCVKLLPLSAFDRNSVGDGYQTACKKCRASIKQEWESKPATLLKRRIRRYEIDEDEFHDLVESQGGRCAICQEIKPLCIDHDHETNFVRGLLCNSCNVGLGHFRDNIKFLRAAADYLDPDIVTLVLGTRLTE